MNDSITVDQFFENWYTEKTIQQVQGDLKALTIKFAQDWGDYVLQHQPNKCTKNQFEINF